MRARERFAIRDTRYEKHTKPTSAFLPEAGGWRLEAGGGWKLEAGSWRLEALR
jgi:hypothetical protein